MSKWESFSAKVRAFGVAITPSIENLTLESLKHFKDEPALWIGAVGAVYFATTDMLASGADYWTVAAVAVAAFAGFVTRRHVSPTPPPFATGGLVERVSFDTDATGDQI